MKRFVLMVVVPAVALLGGGYIYLKSGRYVETDNAYVKADKVQVSTEVAGQVNEVFVRENQSVNAGQLLFSLDPAPYRMAVNQARANLEKVRTDLLEKKAAYLKAEAMLRLAETHREFADKEQRRQQNLKNEHYTSDSDFDNAEQNRRLAEVGVRLRVHRRAHERRARLPQPPRFLRCDPKRGRKRSNGAAGITRRFAQVLRAAAQKLVHRLLRRRRQQVQQR